MRLSDKVSIQQLVITAVALGLKNVVISPGSRNAPLSISFNQHPGVRCTSIRDERSAGFFALGKAIELKEPVAIICTSGSAAINFAPAIVEAYHLRIPLIVFTADRPVAWVGQGDGQTINQRDLYSNYIRKSYELDGDTVSEEKLWYNNRCLNEGFFIAMQKDPGPVHFNIPLSEPLYNSAEEVNFTPRIFLSPATEQKIPDAQIQHLQNVFAQTQKVMIVAGQQWPDETLNSLLIKIAAQENTIVLSESTSNIHHPNFIENIDRCIMPMKEEEIASFMPDLLITIGGAVVSKKIKALLRNHPPSQHWNVNAFDATMDTYRSLTHPIDQHPAVFFKQLLSDLPAVIASSYKTKWLHRSAEMKERQMDFSNHAGYSDYFAFKKIFEQMSAGLHVHLANSSPVRYAQLFDSSKIKMSHSNRGASGIDGCTSTAMGAASANEKEAHLLITGDIAFFYDNNGLWNDHTPTNLNIIMINNGGGGIFRIIPGPSGTEILEEYFETKHQKSAKKLVEFYEWNYLSANDPGSLDVGLKTFFAPGTQQTVLEIFTPNEINSQVLASYWNHLRSSIL